MKLSVLMSVYSMEVPSNLRDCLESLANQTRPADEIVIVEDGPIGKALAAVIEDFRETLPIVSIHLQTNVGLGKALHTGLESCCGLYVARMDSDDICMPERFERQIAYLDSHPEVDVAGAAIAEFERHFSDAHTVRSTPTDGDSIRRYARWRNPLNHVTAVFRRSSVESVGGYRPSRGFEDYYLWTNMLARGYRLSNMEDILVYVRCGNGMLERRGGWAYLKAEIQFQRYLCELDFQSLWGAAACILVRGVVRLSPIFIRALCYRLFLRRSLNRLPHRSYPGTSPGFQSD